MPHGIAQGQLGMFQEVLGDAYDLPCCVPESPERAAQRVSWKRGKSVRYLGNIYRKHESSRVVSRLVYCDGCNGEDRPRYTTDV